MEFAAWLDFTGPLLFDRLGLALLTLAPAVNRLLDGVEEVFIAERFRQEFARAGFHGAHGHRDVAVTGDENDGKPNIDLGEFLLQLKTAEAR